MAKYSDRVRSLSADDPRIPTEAVTKRLGEVLYCCRLVQIVPDNVDVSTEGGSIVQFVKGDVYADIELLNSGEALAAISLRGKPSNIWAIDGDDDFDMREALRRIATALHGKP